MTTPHDQAIREAAEKIERLSERYNIDGGFTGIRKEEAESILRDLVAKAVADDHKRFADSCRGELVDLRAQLTAAQDEVERLREDYEAFGIVAPADLGEQSWADVRARLTTLRAAAEQAKGALEEARQRLDHNIPHHAYGDNQAAVEMSARIDEADGNLLSVLTALSAALTRHP